MIDKLSRQTHKLERMTVTIGTARDNADFRDNLNEEKDRGMELIHDIVREIKARGSDDPTIQRVTSGFEIEARKFQEVVETIRDKEERVLHTHTPNVSTGSEDDLKVGLLEGQIQVDGKLSALEAKKNQIKNLEADVTELASMFQDIASLVDDQQHVVDHIAVSVEHAVEATGGAAEQLQKAEAYQRSARRRMLCCFVLLLIVLGIIALIIYLIVKK